MPKIIAKTTGGGRGGCNPLVSRDGTNKVVTPTLKIKDAQ